MHFKIISDYCIFLFILSIILLYSSMNTFLLNKINLINCLIFNLYYYFCQSNVESQRKKTKSFRLNFIFNMRVHIYTVFVYLINLSHNFMCLYNKFYVL